MGTLHPAANPVTNPAAKRPELGALPVGGDLDAVRVFVEVVRAGGFTAAARRLAMPKSTVSRRVSELEQRLKVRLLQRTTRSVSLSDAGSAYFARAERALSELLDAETAVGALHASPRGTLRMTAPVDLGQVLLAPVIARFEQTYPEVSVVVDLDDRRVDLVAEAYDLALRASERLDDSSLVARKLFTTRHGLFASPAYLDAHGRPKTPEDLREHDLVLFRSTRLKATWRLSRGGDDVTELDVRGRTSSTSVGFLLPAAIEGLGIAPVPLFGCCEPLLDGRLERVLPDYELGTSHLFGVYPSSRHLSPNVKAFLDLASEYLLSRERDAATACAAHPKASAKPPVTRSSSTRAARKRR